MTYSRVRHLSLVAGLGIGLALGLVYTWVVNPVELINTYPALLRTDHRRDWVRLAALSYVADNDLERVRVRLDGLGQEDIASAIRPLIEEYAAAGHSAETLRRLTTLAQAFDVQTPAMLVYLYSPSPSPPASIAAPSPASTPFPVFSSIPIPNPTSISAPTITPTPHTPSPAPALTFTPVESTKTFLPTLTPSPTPTPTPIPPLLARLGLAEQEQLCQRGEAEHIEVVVQDESGTGLPGVAVWLMWPGGADRAVTGLKPQQGAGYADFDAEWGVNYSLGVGELGIPLITGLRLEPCSADRDEEPIIGSWRIILEPYSSDTG
jgi:hypothetical protein